MDSVTKFHVLVASYFKEKVTEEMLEEVEIKANKIPGVSKASVTHDGDTITAEMTFEGDVYQVRLHAPT